MNQLSNTEALEQLIRLREHLTSTGDLTKGYQLAFDRVIQRLSLKVTQERIWNGHLHEQRQA